MDDQSIDSWLAVLTYWRDKKRRTGLSFSFLVGATRSPIGEPFGDEEEAEAYSEALYEKIAAHEFAYIEECAIVGDLAVKLGARTGTSLPTFDRIWKRFRDEIISGKFSLSGGKSRRFDDTERVWIKQARRIAGIEGD